MGFSFKKFVDPGGHFQGTINLRTIIDPGDILGGQAASDRLKASGNVLLLGKLRAVNNAMEQFFESKGLLQPFVDAGHDAAAELKKNIGTDAPLVKNQKALGQSIIAKEAERLGAKPNEIGGALSKFSKDFAAREGDRRYGRAMDAAKIALGGTAAGAGLSAQLSGRESANFLSGAANIVQGQAEAVSGQLSSMANVTYGISSAFNQRGGKKTDPYEPPSGAGEVFLYGEDDESFR